MATNSIPAEPYQGDIFTTDPISPSDPISFPQPGPIRPIKPIPGPVRPISGPVKTLPYIQPISVTPEIY